MITPADRLPDDEVSRIDRTDRLVLAAIAIGWPRPRLERKWSRRRVSRMVAVCGGRRRLAARLVRDWDRLASRPVQELSPLRPADCRVVADA
ncbi:hypothetical protein GA0070616_4396 [Micromonospora nigra]|uniref:Uncharacterized protein n=1 Tax=Micromonospora nigra TaxID=145857 RepID=A0A1C6SRN4_9ACTN|nr:hypothetical protein [Micromonospora nigra]SCL32148.1 hypothetical protein GA0070616_4396 [Micromonospora nigra]